MVFVMEIRLLYERFMMRYMLAPRSGRSPELAHLRNVDGALAFFTLSHTLLRDHTAYPISSRLTNIPLSLKSPPAEET